MKYFITSGIHQAQLLSSMHCLHVCFTSQVNEKIGCKYINKTTIDFIIFLILRPRSEYKNNLNILIPGWSYLVYSVLVHFDKDIPLFIDQ